MPLHPLLEASWLFGQVPRSGGASRTRANGETIVMSMILIATSLLLTGAPTSDAAEQRTEQRVSERIRHRDRASYPANDLLSGQTNRFPGVDWTSVEIRQVAPTAFPGVDWQPAGHCRGQNGQVGYVYRASGDADDRPTEEVAFYYQKIVFAAAPSARTSRNIGSSGEDGVSTQSNIGSSGQDGVRAPRSTPVLTSVQWPYRLEASAVESSNHCPR
jgi:hypothetical protein